MAEARACHRVRGIRHLEGGHVASARTPPHRITGRCRSNLEQSASSVGTTASARRCARLSTTSSCLSARSQAPRPSVDESRSPDRGEGDQTGSRDPVPPAEPTRTDPAGDGERDGRKKQATVFTRHDEAERPAWKDSRQCERQEDDSCVRRVEEQRHGSIIDTAEAARGNSQAFFMNPELGCS